MLGTNHSYLCPLTTIGQLKHFHSDKKNFWPLNQALPLFHHILPGSYMVENQRVRRWGNNQRLEKKKIFKYLTHLVVPKGGI